MMPDLESTRTVRAPSMPPLEEISARRATVPETHRRLARPPLPPPTTFIGRRTEMATALHRLRDERIRLLTLTGVGGIGKTRLALEIAQELTSDFAGKIAWVSLAPVRDSSLVVPAIASAIGVQESVEAELLDRLIDTLEQERLVLVLDNFEHVLAAASDVSALLRACPRVIALATSRAPLRISGEHVLVVPALPVPQTTSHTTPRALDQIESVRLFVDRAKSVSPAFSVDAETALLVSNICQRLDGLPLAIELAAARTYHLSVRTMNDRLAKRLPLLTGGPADLPNRQQTLRKSISWSYELLDAEKQRLFQRLAVFSGGFSIEAAETLGDDAATALDQLTTLVDESLVQYLDDTPAGPRYTMLETIHEFAAEYLAQSGDETAARARHAAFYLNLAQQSDTNLAGGAGNDWATRLEMEQINLRQALHWLAETRQWSDFLQLAAALGAFWDTRGHLSEGRAFLERALLETESGDVSERLRALAATRLALILVRQGAFGEAGSWLDLALRVWSDEHEPARLAATLCVLGGVAEYSGDDAQAQAHYARGLVLYREVGEPAGTATVLNNLADTAYRLGDLTRAATLAEEAVAIARDAGLEVIRATALFTVAEVLIAQGEWQAALVALQDGLRTSHAAGYRLGTADALCGFAVVAAAGGASEQAARLLGSVDFILDDIGARRVPHQALHHRAFTLARGALEETAFTAAWDAGRAHPFADVVADAVQVSVAPALELQAPLTSRELDVLRLLATGKSDRAIGEALFIGTRTVESHVASIFTKLRVHSRAAAVAAALAAGMLEPCSAAAPLEPILEG